MKRLLFLLITFVVALLPTRAQGDVPIPPVKFPLVPVTPDSVRLDDFFWEKQCRAFRPEFPDLRPQALKASKKDVKKLLPAWQRDLSTLGILAEQPSDTVHTPVEAAVDMVERSARLMLATGQARYANIMEYCYYNGLAGRQGSKDASERQLAAQAITSMLGTFYATSGNHLYVNMPVRALAHVKTKKLDTEFCVTASEPWYSEVFIRFTKFTRGDNMVLHVRIPSWVEDGLLPSYQENGASSRVSMMVNGQQVMPEVKDGYVVIARHWNDSDLVYIKTPTQIKRISALDNPNLISLRRGVLSYSFLNLPAGMSVRSSDAIHAEFDKTRGTLVLSAPYYNRSGKKAGMYLAEPTLFNRENPMARLRVPFVP